MWPPPEPGLGPATEPAMRGPNRHPNDGGSPQVVHGEIEDVNRAVGADRAGADHDLELKVGVPVTVLDKSTEVMLGFK